MTAMSSQQGLTVKYPGRDPGLARGSQRGGKGGSSTEETTADIVSAEASTNEVEDKFK